MRSFRLYRPEKGDDQVPTKRRALVWILDGFGLFFLAFLALMLGGAWSLAERPGNGRMIHTLWWAAPAGCFLSLVLLAFGIRYLAKGITALIAR